jgi:hypothetical protein
MTFRREWTQDLPACSTVSQPTTLPHGPLVKQYTQAHQTEKTFKLRIIFTYTGRDICWPVLTTLHIPLSYQDDVGRHRHVNSSLWRAACDLQFHYVRFANLKQNKVVLRDEMLASRDHTFSFWYCVVSNVSFMLLAIVWWRPNKVAANTVLASYCFEWGTAVAQSVCRLATGWTTKESEFESRWCQAYSTFHIGQSGLGTNPTPNPMGTGGFFGRGISWPLTYNKCRSQRKRGSIRQLRTHLHGVVLS